MIQSGRKRTSKPPPGVGRTPTDTAALLRKRGQRGPQKADTRELVNTRLDRDVVDRFRAAGPGWQTRVNAALRRAASRLQAT